MKSYRTVISCDYPIYNEEVGTNGRNIISVERKYFPIDYQDDRTVTATSNVVSHPLMNGDTISDHMYRNPTELNISGVFSLNGRNYKNKSYDFIGNSNDRLTNIQKVFEFIKNNAILCDIVTLEIDVDKPDPDDDSKSEYSSANTRFISRHNMALYNISWTEKLNSIQFRFSFKEIISISLDDFIVDTDLDLPCIYQPRVASIGTVLNDLGMLKQTIIQILNDNGYIDKVWANGVWEAIGKNTLGVMQIPIYASIAALIGIVVFKIAVAVALKLGIITAAFASSSAIFPVGTIIAAAAGVVIGIGLGIKKLINYNEEKRKKKLKFKMVNDKIDTDLDRMVNLIDTIGRAMNTQVSNLIVYDFQFSDNEDDTKINNQYLISVGNEQYYLNVVSKNVEPFFDIQIFSSKANGGEEINPKQIKNKFPVVTNLQDCKNTRVWFTDTTGEYKVFLVNIALCDEVNDTENKKLSIMPHWSGYTIWVCKGNMEDQLKVVNDTIIQELEKEGFK